MNDYRISEEVFSNLFQNTGLMSAVVCSRPDLLEKSVNQHINVSGTSLDEHGRNLFSTCLRPEDIKNYQKALLALDATFRVIIDKLKSGELETAVIHLLFIFPSNGPWIHALSEIRGMLYELSIRNEKSFNKAFTFILHFGTANETQTFEIGRQIRDLCHIYIADYDPHATPSRAKPNQLLFSKNEPARQRNEDWPQSFNLIELADS